MHTFSGHSGVALFPFLNFSIAVQEQEITGLTKKLSKTIEIFLLFVSASPEFLYVSFHLFSMWVVSREFHE